MKKAKILSSSLALTSSFFLAAFFAIFAPDAQASRDGYYGGIGIGRVAEDFIVEDFYKEFVRGKKKVDLGNYHQLVKNAIDKEGLCLAIGTTGQTCPPTLTLNDLKSNINTITVDNENIDNNDETIFFDTLGDFDSSDQVKANKSKALLKQVFEDPGTNNYVIRIFGGYNFNKFFGFEAGGFATTTLTTKTKDISVNYPTPVAPTTIPPTLSPPAGKYLISTQVDLTSDTTLAGLELLGTLSLPLDPFYAYAKAGVAYVSMMTETRLKITGKVRDVGSSTTTTTSGTAPKDEDIDVFSDKDNSSLRRIRPVLAAGIGFRPSRNVTLDLSYQRYNFSNDKNSSNSNGFLSNKSLGNQPTLSNIFLSIVYEFTEEKCGDLNC